MISYQTNDYTKTAYKNLPASKSFNANIGHKILNLRSSKDEL